MAGGWNPDGKITDFGVNYVQMQMPLRIDDVEGDTEPVSTAALGTFNESTEMFARLANNAQFIKNKMLVEDTPYIIGDLAQLDALQETLDVLGIIVKGKVLTITFTAPITQTAAKPVLKLSNIGGEGSIVINNSNHLLTRDGNENVFLFENVNPTITLNNANISESTGTGVLVRVSDCKHVKIISGLISGNTGTDSVVAERSRIDISVNTFGNGGFPGNIPITLADCLSLIQSNSFINNSNYLVKAIRTKLSVVSNTCGTGNVSGIYALEGSEVHSSGWNSTAKLSGLSYYANYGATIIFNDSGQLYTNSLSFTQTGNGGKIEGMLRKSNKYIASPVTFTITAANLPYLNQYTEVSGKDIPYGAVLQFILNFVSSETISKDIVIQGFAGAGEIQLLGLGKASSIISGGIPGIDANVKVVGNTALVTLANFRINTASPSEGAINILNNPGRVIVHDIAARNSAAGSGIKVSGSANTKIYDCNTDALGGGGDDNAAIYVTENSMVASSSNGLVDQAPLYGLSATNGGIIAKVDATQPLGNPSPANDENTAGGGVIR